MSKVEIDEVTLRNLVRGTEQEIDHLQELADDDDCPERVSKRLERNKRSLEGSVEIAKEKLE